MKTPKSFRFPASITDPEKIMDAMTDDQQNAVSEYVGAGVAEYYSGLIEELNQTEETIRKQRRIIYNLLRRCPVVHLAGGINCQAGMN